MSASDHVIRPLRKSDFVLRFESPKAARAWTDLLAVRRNAVVDAWEKLTSSPMTSTELCYRMTNELAVLVRNGRNHQRWQLKLNERDGARIWYFVIDQTVIIEKVHTSHPNESK